MKKLLNRIFGIVDRNNKRLKVGDYVECDQGKRVHVKSVAGNMRIFEEMGIGIYKVTYMDFNGDLHLLKCGKIHEGQTGVLWMSADDVCKISEEDALIKILKGEVN